MLPDVAAASLLEDVLLVGRRRPDIECDSRGGDIELFHRTVLLTKNETYVSSPTYRGVVFVLMQSVGVNENYKTTALCSQTCG